MYIKSLTLSSVWGIADGSRQVNVDGEIIAYAVLDVLAKGVFGFWLLITHDSMAQTVPSIDGFWSNGISHEGTLRVSLFLIPSTIFSCVR